MDLSPFLFEEKRLRRYLSRTLRGREDVEDYVQEVYERVLNGAEPARIHNAWGFLKRIAACLIVDRVRRDRSRMVRDHQPLRDDHDFDDDGVGSPERIHLAREELELLHASLESLSPRMREVFFLVRFEGLSHGEVAQKLGMDTKAVSRQVERAMLYLARAVLEEDRT